MDITDHLRELIDDLSNYNGIIRHYSNLVIHKPTFLHTMYIINTDDYLTFRRNFKEITNFLWI